MSNLAWRSGSPQGVIGCSQPFGVSMKWLASFGAPRVESSIWACAVARRTEAAPAASRTVRLVDMIVRMCLNAAPRPATTNDITLAAREYRLRAANGCPLRAQLSVHGA